MTTETTNIDFEMTTPLRTTDFDRYRKLKPSAVLQLFQEAATRQAERMGIGVADMAKHEVLWAVIRTSYDVIKQPQLYDVVRVRTWPHDVTKFSFLRDYQIRNLDGELIIKGTSEWVLMSAQDRSFVSILDVYTGTLDFVEERNYDSKPRKLRNFDHEGLTPHTLYPSYSTVDLNGHVNNSMYADFLIDAVDPGKGYSVRSFQIDYRREVRENEELQIYLGELEHGIQAKGLDSDGNVMFAARIEV